MTENFRRLIRNLRNDQTMRVKQNAADRLAHAVAILVCSGKLDSRSKVADSLLDYLEVGGLDGPSSVPEWMAEYEKSQKGSA